MSERTDRVSSVLRRGTQSVISEGFADPRLENCMITVTSVGLDRDLTTATINVSVLPDTAERRALAGLRSAAKHIRRRVAERVNVHRMPRFEFRIDTAAKRQASVLDALAKARSEFDQPTGDEPSPPDTDRLQNQTDTSATDPDDALPHRRHTP